MRSSVDRFTLERTADSMREKCRSCGWGAGPCTFIGNLDHGTWRTVRFTVESDASTINPVNRCAPNRNSR